MYIPLFSSIELIPSFNVPSVIFNKIFLILFDLSSILIGNHPKHIADIV
jgi:hypothetical protein